MKKMMFFLSLCFIMLLSSCGTSSYYTSSYNAMDGIYYRPSRESKEAVAADDADLKSLTKKTETQVKKFVDTVVLSQNSNLTLNAKPGEQYAIVLDGTNENAPTLDYSLNINIDYGWDNYNYWRYYDPWYSWYYPYFWRWGRPFYPYYYGYYGPYWPYWGPWGNFYFGFGYDPWYWDWYYPYYPYSYYSYYPYYDGGYYNRSSAYYGKRGVRNSSALSTGVRQNSIKRNVADKSIRNTNGIRSANLVRNAANLQNISGRRNDNVSGNTSRRENAVRNIDRSSGNITSRRTVLNQIKRDNNLNTAGVNSTISETGRRSEGLSRRDIYFNSGNDRNNYRGSVRNDGRSNTHGSSRSNLIYRRSPDAERHIFNDSNRQNSNSYFNNTRSNYNTQSYRNSISNSSIRSYGNGSSGGGSVRSSSSSGSVRSSGGGGSRTRR